MTSLYMYMEVLAIYTHVQYVRVAGQEGWRTACLIFGVASILLQEGVLLNPCYVFMGMGLG